MNPDQRSDWTDMRNFYGSKFSMTWIGAHMDLSEYNDLLGHAANLGLEGVWLFQALDDTDDGSENNIATYCDQAWKHGWLTKYVHIYSDLEEYDEEAGTWVYLRTVDTHQIKILEPNGQIH